MATSTRAVLRVLVENNLGGASFTARTCTAQGGAAGATLIDSGLGSKGTDYYKGWWAVLPNGPTGSSSAYEAREINTSVTTTGVLTPYTAFTGQIANAQSYELHRYDPAQIHQAINEAIEELFSKLSIPLLDESLIVDNLLTNGDFESTIAGGAHPSWTNVGSPTVTAETSRIWHGAQAAKVVAGGSAGQMTQTPTININEVTGKSAKLGAMIYCTAASTARIRLDWDGSNFENESYHTGADQWERFELSGSIPSTATQVKAILETIANGTAYFDSTWLAIDKVYKYTLPTSFIKVSSVEIQTDPNYSSHPFIPLTHWHYEEDASGKYLILDSSGYPAGYRLQVHGMGVLSTLSSDTGTVEIGSPERQTLVAAACRNLMFYYYEDAASSDKEDFAKKMDYWDKQTRILLASPGMRTRRQGVPVNPRWRYG